MGQFHKSIEKRMDAFGERINKVWKDGFDFGDEIKDFCNGNDIIMEKFKNFNNKVGDVLNDPNIDVMTKGMLELQNDTLFDMVKKMAQPLSDMVYKNKELIDESRGFREVMINGMQAMVDNKQNLKLAENTVTKFEELVAKYEKDNEIIRNRIDTVKSGFGDAEKYFESLKN